jgi:integrase
VISRYAVAAATPINPAVGELRAIIGAYLDERYTVAHSRSQANRLLGDLFRSVSPHGVHQVTPTDVRRFATGPLRDGSPPANNTVRQRLSTARAFYAWAVRRGYAEQNPADELDQLRKQFPRLYGKAQQGNPARWLSYDQAYGQLIDACRDGSWQGSRDNLVIRLGLLGLRRAEICRLTWGSYHDGSITCMGKGRKVRRVEPGPVLVELLDRWHRQYERAIGRAVEGDDPLICGASVTRYDPERHGFASGPKEIAWGKGIRIGAVNALVEKRASAAGLDHVAPHDLRRTAAGIMHHARSADGGHLFDLLDIQKVALRASEWVTSAV